MYLTFLMGVSARQGILINTQTRRAAFGLCTLHFEDAWNCASYILDSNHMRRVSMITSLWKSTTTTPQLWSWLVDSVVAALLPRCSLMERFRISKWNFIRMKQCRRKVLKRYLKKLIDWSIDLCEKTKTEFFYTFPYFSCFVVQTVSILRKHSSCYLAPSRSFQLP